MNLKTLLLSIKTGRTRREFQLTNSNVIKYKTKIILFTSDNLPVKTTIRVY